MKYKKIIAFGDSFTWGTDLKDCNNTYSKSVWPALLASHLGLVYDCRALGGISNQSILRHVLINLDYGILTPDTFVVINWTWLNRWDLFDFTVSDVAKNQDWNHGWNTVLPSESLSKQHKFYLNHIQSALTEKFETLKNIFIVSELLTKHNIKFLMTCVDETLVDQEHFFPEYVDILYKHTTDNFLWFDNYGFYSWAKNNGYAISKGWHPLEEAHQAAFEYIINNYEFT